MAQSLSSILIHLVFSTKHRTPIITPEIEPELYAYLTAVFRQCDSPTLSVGGDADHLHILFSLSRRRSMAEIVEEIKTSSSKWMKRKGRQFESFHWQSGYGAFSIGQSNVPALKRYIAEQKEHHRKTTFQDEFRTFLQRYQVEYDERYVWD